MDDSDEGNRALVIERQRKARAERLAADRPRQSASQIAGGVMGCSVAMVVIGIMALIGLAVVIWAWRTVFGA